MPLVPCEECGGRVVMIRDERSCDACGLVLDEQVFAGISAPLWPRGEFIYPTRVQLPLVLQADFHNQPGPPWVRTRNVAATSRERAIVTMMRLIRGELSRLGLPQEFAGRALQICKDAVSHRGTRPHREYLVPASILMVARERHVAILYKDLHANPLGRKYVMRKYRALAAATLRPPSAFEYVAVLAEKMSLPWEVIRAAKKLIPQFLAVAPGARPINLAAATLYVSSRKAGYRINKSDVTGVSAPTLHRLLLKALGTEELRQLSRGKGPRLVPPSSENVQHA